MRIVQLIPELNEGGVERGTADLNRELVRRGLESIVISSGGRLVAQVDADGGRHCLFDVGSKNPCTVPLRIFRLRRLLRLLKPDLLHARSRMPAWLTWLANRDLQIPFVTTVHGFNRVNAYSRVMTYGDRIICVSHALRDYILRHYPVMPGNIVVIPRGIDLEKFDPSHVDRAFREEFLSRYRLKQKFVVTTVGRITPLKDLETFISALVHAKREIPDLAGVIAGGVREDKTGYFSRLQNQIIESGAESYIHFVGSQSKIAEIYSLSDIVVSASKKPESFGRSAAEALAMEVPVVASAHGGILDIVIPGRTGFLFPPGDATALASGLLFLRKNRLHGLRDFVASNFTLRAMVEATLRVYSDVVENQQRKIPAWKSPGSTR